MIDVKWATESWELGKTHLDFFREKYQNYVNNMQSAKDCLALLLKSRKTNDQNAINYALEKSLAAINQITSAALPEQEYLYPSALINAARYFENTAKSNLSLSQLIRSAQSCYDEFEKFIMPDSLFPRSEFTTENLSLLRLFSKLTT